MERASIPSRRSRDGNGTRSILFSLGKACRDEVETAFPKGTGKHRDVVEMYLFPKHRDAVEMYRVPALFLHGS